MTPIHIWVRATLDWQDRALVDARVLPGFRPKLETWNATFDMPYHLFRHRVTSIARLNLSRVEAATCSALGEIPAGHLIVPVDARRDRRRDPVHGAQGCRDGSGPGGAG